MTVQPSTQPISPNVESLSCGCVLDHNSGSLVHWCEAYCSSYNAMSRAIGSPLTPPGKARLHEVMTEHIDAHGPRRVAVWIPQGSNEDEPSYWGWIGTGRWNGWLCPSFERAEADRLAAEHDTHPFDPETCADHLHLRYDEAHDAFLELDPNYYEETVERPYESDGVTFGPGVTSVYRGYDLPNGTRVYPIGSSGWCWETRTQHDEDIRLLVAAHKGGA